MYRDYGKVVLSMLLSYVLENTNKEEIRDNTPLFQLIHEMEIDENYIFIDSEGQNRNELEEMLSYIEKQDIIVIRSVLDLADTLEELKEILRQFTEKQISLCSCIEPYLSGEDFFETFNSFITIYKVFIDRKKKSGYQKAVAEGRVGRPVKAKDLEKAISLYEEGRLDINQVVALTGVSKSTIYRYLNK